LYLRGLQRKAVETPTTSISGGTFSSESGGIAGNGRIGTTMHAANNISLPEPLLAEIQSAAEAEHRSVDEVLSDAVKRYVEERSWTKLLGYGEERSKELGIKESDIDRLIAESRAEHRGS
jgi:hypothetical protein